MPEAKKNKKTFGLQSKTFVIVFLLQSSSFHQQVKLFEPSMAAWHWGMTQGYPTNDKIRVPTIPNLYLSFLYTYLARVWFPMKFFTEPDFQPSVEAKADVQQVENLHCLFPRPVLVPVSHMEEDGLWLLLWPLAIFYGAKAVKAHAFYLAQGCNYK